MTDQANHMQAPTGHRQRGKGFPTMPLDEAAEVIKTAGQYGRNHTRGSFAGYLGHSSATSGPFRQKLAALNDWGFIERSGDDVTLTDLAWHIAHPESGDTTSAMREAFLNADLFEATYNDSAKGMPLKLDLIGNRAVTTLDVAAKSKSTFAKSFAKSAVAAGLAKMEDGGIRLLALDAGADASPEPSEEPPAESASTVTTPPAGKHEKPPVTIHESVSAPPTIHQEWEVKDGALVFEARLSGAMPAAAFKELGGIFEAVEKLVNQLGAPEQAAAESPAAAEATTPTAETEQPDAEAEPAEDAAE